MLKVHGLDFFPFEVKRNYNDLIFGFFGFNIKCLGFYIYFPKHGTFDFGFNFWCLGLKIKIFTKIMLFNII
jgi:hypothetical protein